MARTALTLYDLDSDGLNPTFVAATADGHAFNNEGANVFLWVKNDNASAVTVTIATPIQLDGEDLADKTVSVPASEERLIGLFPRHIYNQDDTAGDTGILRACFVNYSIQSSVTVAAVRIP